MKYSFVAVVSCLLCVVSALPSPSPHWKKHATPAAYAPHQVEVQPMHVQIVRVPVYTKTVFVERPVVTAHSGMHKQNKKHGHVSSPSFTHTQQYKPQHVAPQTVQYVAVPQQVTFTKYNPAPPVYSGHQYSSGHSGYGSGHVGGSFDLHGSWGKSKY